MVLLMTLQPEISSGAKVTHFKAAFKHFLFLKLVPTHLLRALAHKEVSLPIVPFIAKRTRRVKSKGLYCFSRVTGGKENLGYWSTQY